MLLTPTKTVPEPLSRDESLATVAHELRNPLATILFALETMASDCVGGLSAPLARTIVERQARRAMQIVDDLFDVCALSWGKLLLRKELVELAEVVAGAAETTAHVLAARGHRLSVSLPAWPVFLIADPLRLEQVLTNLLSNAAKFTAANGHIRLLAEVEAGQIVLRVRDNGRGIAPDLLPGLFEPFHQISGQEIQGKPGLGLGLALVKALVELHGGSVAASSDGPGSGSEFVVRLPPRNSGQ
jgi:signal transduction histidine kinase